MTCPQKSMTVSSEIKAFQIFRDIQCSPMVTLQGIKRNKTFNFFYPMKRDFVVVVVFLLCLLFI